MYYIGAHLQHFVTHFMNQQSTLILHLKLNLRYVKSDLILAFRQNHLQKTVSSKY